jgi:dTDP-4-dehydrorhamnose reductase
VLRSNFIGRSRRAGRTSLTDWIVKSLRAEQGITVFEDVFFSALHIDTLCAAIESTIEKRHPGTFNLGCSDGNSKAALAFGIADRLGLCHSLLKVGRSQDAEFRARRPLDMRMDSSSFARSFGIALPTFESQIDLVAQEYQHE